jgi:hypothetical protein
MRPTKARIGAGCGAGVLTALVLLPGGCSRNPAMYVGGELREVWPRTELRRPKRVVPVTMACRIGSGYGSGIGAEDFGPTVRDALDRSGLVRVVDGEKEAAEAHIEVIVHNVMAPEDRARTAGGAAATGFSLGWAASRRDLHREFEGRFSRPGEEEFVGKYRGCACFITGAVRPKLKELEPLWSGDSVLVLADRFVMNFLLDLQRAGRL